MDVKSTFLNGYFKEKAYVTQSKGVQNPHYSVETKEINIRVKTNPKRLVRLIGYFFTQFYRLCR